ncbi:TPA: hypothetical protein ACH3X3_011160 [Trebouxia sp. C0006]
MPLKDMATSATQQEEFHMLLLKGTVSGNLPFSWIDNEYIQAAFAIARPTAVLPSRRALSEKLLKKAAGFNLAAYMDSPAVVKAPLSSIFGSALLPLLDDDTVNTY